MPPQGGRRQQMSMVSVSNGGVTQRHRAAGGILPGAERQQQFLTNTVVHVLEAQSVLALVAQDFKYGRSPFFGDLDPRIIQVHHVHL